MSKDRIGGSCLCGQVRFQVHGPYLAFHLCHCSRCRKETGSAHAANLFTAAGNIEWLEGESLVKRFDLPDAERFARAFCTECGGPVPYTSRDGRFLIVPAGSLDGDPGVRPDDNIFWRDRAPWEEEGHDAPRFDTYATEA